MIKLFSVKDKGDGGDGGEAPPKPAVRRSAAELRLQKDISELSLPDTITLEFPEEGNLLQFEVTVRPDEGYYKGGNFTFSFNIRKSYPHEPPKVKCLTKVYHPNIDLEGNVCLNILREDWKPVLSISAVIYGLQFLFLEPNPSDPLNKDAADALQDNPRAFQMNVKRSMAGAYIGSEYFPPCT
mmetsp:Transcript_2648/g.7297  ORF Transcript_2648/g.7297 Transcript_2648/m.7297 type:complete len:183 (+) Transcript_2648:3-551(+)